MTTMDNLTVANLTVANLTQVTWAGTHVLEHSAYAPPNILSNFYYKSYPPLVIATILVCMQTRVEWYNTVTYKSQAKKVNLEDLKYMSLPMAFAFPFFLDALYDMMTNLDSSMRSATTAIIFAVIEGLLTVSCVMLIIVSQCYHKGCHYRISVKDYIRDGKNGCKYERLATDDDDDDEEDNNNVDNNNNEVEVDQEGYEVEFKFNRDNIIDIITTEDYRKYNGYYRLNYMYGSTLYSFLSCLTYIIKSISIYQDSETPDTNLMWIYTFILLAIQVILMIFDYFTPYIKIIFSSYIVMFCYGCSILIDFHNIKQEIDISMIIYSILTLGSATIKISNIADDTKTKFIEKKTN